MSTCLQQNVESDMRHSAGQAGKNDKVLNKGLKWIFPGRIIFQQMFFLFFFFFVCGGGGVVFFGIQKEAFQESQPCDPTDGTFE